jgi:nitrite reductase/ring-hydroxylating ferredoxin subunit
LEFYLTNIKLKRAHINAIPFSLFTTVFSLVTISLFFSCSKDSNDTTIPSVPVNYTIYLTLPQYTNLNSPGSYSIVDGHGYRGIIVYRRSQDEFVAFDLACPYDPTTSGAILTVDSSGITMVDAHCGSKFSLYDGSILKGPATRPMKGYNTSYDPSTYSVMIFN